MSRHHRGELQNSPYETSDKHRNLGNNLATLPDRQGRRHANEKDDQHQILIGHKLPRTKHEDQTSHYDYERQDHGINVGGQRVQECRNGHAQHRHGDHGNEQRLGREKGIPQRGLERRHGHDVAYPWNGERASRRGNESEGGDGEEGHGGGPGSGGDSILEFEGEVLDGFVAEEGEAVVGDAEWKP